MIKINCVKGAVLSVWRVQIREIIVLNVINCHLIKENATPIVLLDTTPKPNYPHSYPTPLSPTATPAPLNA